MNTKNLIGLILIVISCTPDMPTSSDVETFSEFETSTGEVTTGNTENTGDPNDEVCGNGILSTEEECDDGNVIDDDECSNECSKFRYAFLSDIQIYANFGSLDVPNKICNTIADEFGLSGSYKAWISNNTEWSANTTSFVNFKGWYKLPADPLINLAKGWKGLVIDSLHHPLNIHADGSINENGDNVWTGTLPNGEGLMNYNCNEWTEFNFETKAFVGSIQDVAGAWTYNGQETCNRNNTRGFYCFQI